MKTKKSLGFTLMELLIVIAIIGILVSVSVVSYSSAQKKSRDSRRIGDMKAVQSAWEQYYADNSANYPGPASPSAPVACALSMMPTPATYLPGGLPVDPKTGTSYASMYDGWSRCNSASFCFCAGVESAASSNAATDCAGTATVGYAGLYCVHNLQ